MTGKTSPASEARAIFTGVAHLHGDRKWRRSLRVRSAVIKTQRALVNWRNMRIRRALAPALPAAAIPPPASFLRHLLPPRPSPPGSRTGDILTWVDIKAAAKRGDYMLSPESASAGLRGGIRPYADVASQPLRQRRDKEDERANERRIEGREFSLSREKEKEKERRSLILRQSWFFKIDHVTMACWRKRLVKWRWHYRNGVPSNTECIIMTWADEERDVARDRDGTRNTVAVVRDDFEQRELHLRSTSTSGFPRVISPRRAS